MEVTFQFSASQVRDTIDLEDYGYDENTSWNDLTEE